MAVFKKKQPPEPTDEKPAKDGESSEKGFNGEEAYQEQALHDIATGDSLSEVISTVRTAQAFGTQKTLSKLYEAFTMRAWSWENNIAISRGLGVGAMVFIVHASDAGVAVNVFFSIIIGAFSLSNMAPELQAVTIAQAAAAKLFVTIDRGLKPTELTGHITLENVVFNHPSHPDVPILKGLSLDIPPGTSTALIGASGSGKSTVVSLVERYYDPISSTVKVDGVDIKQLNVKWLLQQIGPVRQEPSLFATTVKNNVAHGLIGSRVPQRDRGGGVPPRSGSVREIERGLVHPQVARRDPALDEATSALDTQSEGLVQGALDKAAAGRTTITIAHRLSTIRDADQIYVVGNGGILEQGTHNQLLANADGPYRPTDSEEAGEDGLMSAKEVKETLAEEVPEALKRTGTGQALERKRLEQGEDKGPYGMVYLVKRMALLDRDDWFSVHQGQLSRPFATDWSTPPFGIVSGKAMDAFSLQDRHELRFQGDCNALWMSVISIISGFAVVMENFHFSRAAAGLDPETEGIELQCDVEAR
ncbi:GTPase-activating protein [Tulasnella sp. 408]|nr:GTPase-activating protein [Tulasnella sp. 408]